MDHSKIKWIFFDMGHTLLDEDEVHISRLEAVTEELAEKGKTCPPVEEMLAEMIDFGTKGARSPFYEVSRKYGSKKKYDYCPALEVPFPETEECLRRLSEKYKLGISGMSVNEALLYPNELVRRVKESDYYQILLPTAVNYYETEKYIFCHGWIPLDIEIVDMTAIFSYRADWRDADEVEWHKARWRNGMDMCCNRNVKEPGKTIVCGHWNCSWGHARIDEICSEYGNDAVTTPFYADGIIAIDACTARWRRVNCIKIED